MCTGAFAPGTGSPSIAVVRKTLLPQTIGEEWPRPGTAAFHLRFLVALHSTGRFFSGETPEPSGPLHCGQFASAPAERTAGALRDDRPTLDARARAIRKRFIF